MERAIVIIGVKKTASSQLPELQAVESSVEAMVEWATAQGFKDEYIIPLTDGKNLLRIHQIKDAIQGLIDKGTIEQLIVYFSGHGMNIRRNEYWLLSRAPNDPQEAVNVTGSVDLARNCGIGHVVIISDACRTAAPGLQAQSITGSEIFPNLMVAGPEKPVDIFFATVLGDPALEIRDAGRTFQALYTVVLLEGLNCKVGDCLEPGRIEGENVSLVRPWPLRWYLDRAVPRRLVAAAISPSISQIPDARITSSPHTWLARKAVAISELERFAPPIGRKAAPNIAPPDTVSPLMAARLEPAEAVARGFIDVRDARAMLKADRAPALPKEAARILKAEAEELAVPFGRGHFETRCGFKVQGMDLVESFHPSGCTGLDGSDSAWVNSPVPVSIVLRITNGSGLILPGIPEFVAGLTFKDENLVNVVYEPADTSSRWSEYQSKIQALRKLRGRIAAATRFGIFEPVGDGVEKLARKMQTSKGLDPTMALYAAYAYHNVQQTGRIREMEEYLFQDLHVRFFDVSLLAGTIKGDWPEPVMPATPLLSQGWALLSARRVDLPASLTTLPRYLTSSLWSTFTPEGVDQLKIALTTKEIPQ